MIAMMAPKILPKKPLKEQAKVLYNYTAENEDELTIKEGDLIYIISKEVEDKGWMKGELNGKIGVFPDNFVEIINPVQQSNQTIVNSFQKLNNFQSSNGTNDNQTKLLAKKSTPETKLSKVITSKFSEIISKSNNSINSETTTPKNSIFLTKNTSNSDDLTNKTSNQVPSLPLKKSKLFSTPKPSFQSVNKESSEENLVDKTDNNDLNSFIEEQNNSINKLTHLTANRVKPPSSRRPPSIIQLPKDDDTNVKNSNSLSNLSELSLSENKSDLEEQKNNKSTEMSSTNSKVATPTLAQQQQPPWMLELKKTQAEKKNVEVGKMKKNFSLGDDSSSLSTSLSSTATTANTFNNNSPNSSKKLNQSPNSPTKLNTTFNHRADRMSGDFTQRFKDFLQQNSTPNVNSLSRHSSVNNNHHNFNSSRTLSTDSLDCKEQGSLGFGNLTSPFPPAKPIKAAKPTTASKFISGSPTTGNTTNSFLNSNLNTSSANNQLSNNQTVANKDTVSRKEFEELQKRVHDLTDIIETQKQTYKGLMKDLINDIAEEKKKVANLSIEVDRLRKLTTTV